jgi:hypothetical protein
LRLAPVQTIKLCWQSSIHPFIRIFYLLFFLFALTLDRNRRHSPKRLLLRRHRPAGSHLGRLRPPCRHACCISCQTAPCRASLYNSQPSAKQSSHVADSHHLPQTSIQGDDRARVPRIRLGATSTAMPSRRARSPCLQPTPTRTKMLGPSWQPVLSSTPWSALSINLSAVKIRQRVRPLITLTGASDLLGGGCSGGGCSVGSAVTR